MYIMYVPLNVSRHEERFGKRDCTVRTRYFFLQAMLKPSTPPMRCQSFALATARAAAAVAAAAAARFCVSGKHATAWLSRINAVEDALPDMYCAYARV